MSKKAFGMIALSLGCALAGAGGTFYWHHLDKQKLTAEFTSQLQVLEQQIQAIGLLQDVYRVRMDVTAGQQIKEEMLEVTQLPTSMITDQFVTSPKAVVGQMFKVDIKAGTPLMLNCVMEDTLTDDMRELDIDACSWPIGLKVGDYFDLNITYPYGETFTILSHVRVDAMNGTTVKVRLNAMERHMYEAAKVDFYINVGSSIDAVKYIEPGLQKKATEYYAVPDNIMAVISADPNIISKADEALRDKRRNLINEVTDFAENDTNLAVIQSGRSSLWEARNQGETARKEEEERKKREAEEAAEQAALYGDTVGGTGSGAAADYTPAEPSNEYEYVNPAEMQAGDTIDMSNNQQVPTTTESTPTASATPSSPTTDAPPPTAQATNAPQATEPSSDTSSTGTAPLADSDPGKVMSQSSDIGQVAEDETYLQEQQEQMFDFERGQGVE